jgi:hypothetical protein
MSRPHSSLETHAGAERRFARRLAAFSRVAALLVSAQLSGVAALAVELASEDGSGECCDDCPLERDGKQCPPGCQSCHCAHGTGIIASAFETTLPRTFDSGRRVLRSRAPAAFPNACASLGVYRPPRTHA